MNNTKNLSLGWHMYMQDNDGHIMAAGDSLTDTTLANGKFVGWIGIPRDETGSLQNITQSNPKVTDEDEIRGIEEEVLYPYVKSHQAYHCPGSQVKSQYDNSRVYASYSIPRCLNGNPRSGKARQTKNFNDIKNPSIRYNFIETGETRNWNANHSFVLAAPELTNQNRWGWWGPMTINRGDKSVLGFCDGHAEARMWRDKFTIERVDKLFNTNASVYGQEYPPGNQQSDIEYMTQGWPFRYKGAK